MHWILKKLSIKDLTYIHQLVLSVLNRKLSHQEKLKLYWDKFPYSSTKICSAPANPSKKDIGIYKSYIKKPTSAKVLLLGSTPSIRQMLNDMEVVNYVVVDFSEIAMKKSFKIIQNINLNNEILIKSNWFNMPLTLYFFNYIIGDLISSQITPEKQQEFMEKIASLLKQGGRFICRIHIQNPNIMSKTPNELIDEFISKNTFRNDPNAKFILLYRLRDRLKDSEKQITYPSLIIKEILNYKTSDEDVMNFLRSVAKVISLRAKNNMEFITQTREEFESNIGKHFKIEKIAVANDYVDAKFFPIFLLKKL